MGAQLEVQHVDLVRVVALVDVLEGLVEVVDVGEEADVEAGVEEAGAVEVDVL